jgi:hypothetical protein
MSNQAGEDIVSAASAQEWEGVDIQESSTAMVSTKSLTHDENAQFSMPDQTFQDLIAFYERSLDASPVVDLDEINFLGLDTGLAWYQYQSSMSVACKKLANRVTTGTTSSAIWKYQPSTTSLFITRGFTRPDHISLVSLALRILRSYPSMLLRQGTLPPFMNPLLFPRAQGGEGNHSQKVRSQPYLPVSCALKASSPPRRVRCDSTIHVLPK